MPENLIVSPGPHIRQGTTTRQIMLDVVIALVPAMCAAAYYFRVRAMVLIAVCVATAMATEWICNKIRHRTNSLGDFSAAITGIILALSLPPMLPWWAGVIGSAFAIAIGKVVFGGLGGNIFNPAMVGRTFLTACFGVLMTTWTVPMGLAVPAGSTIIPGVSNVSPANENIDGITQATPLALSKQAIKSRKLNDKSKSVTAQSTNSLFKNLLIGRRPGCLGETSSVALIIGGIYLLLRRTITFQIPLAVLGSAFVCAAIAYAVNPAYYVAPWIHLVSGGMLLTAFFIATDPVTAPLTNSGMWIFGIGVGALTILIRVLGEYPEGVMYAVLLMNAFTPMIDRFTRQLPLGGVGVAK